MRKRFSFFIVVCTILFCTKCNCNKSVTSPENQLPPATQTGANTFGCLINGQAFLPGGNVGGLTGLHPVYCSYGNNITIGGLHNYISVQSVSLITDSLKIEEGQTYTLKENIPGEASAAYFFGEDGIGQNNYATNNSSNWSGQLIISKLDTINQFISGTFWFKAIDSNGDSVNVTDGRFDLRYTQ